jgi:two-component system, chemotaxis family, chemotaxis protein CheY
MNTDAKILIADDSAFMKRVLKKILAGMGYTNIIEAEDGAKCLELSQSENPDLILLDMIMPAPPGMEVLKEIGAEKSIVVVSAVGQEEVIEEAKKNGALGYVVKPFDNKQVEEAVKAALS